MPIPTNNKPLPAGLMIQDLTDRAIRLKIADACEGYRRKFRAWPTIVWVHPDMLGDYVSPNGLELKADARIPRGYLLVGPLNDAENIKDASSAHCQGDAAVVKELLE